MDTVLKYGTPVILRDVDMSGYCGRELHPMPADVGFIGIVVGNWVESIDDEGYYLGHRDNVLGGTALTDNDAIGYLVQDPSGRRLELMSHEIEEATA